MAFWDSGAVILEDNVLHICKRGTDALQQQVEWLNRNDLIFSLLLHTVLSSGAQGETQVQLQNDRHGWATKLLPGSKASTLAVLTHCIPDKPWWGKCENTHRGWWESCQRQRHCLVPSLCFPDLTQTAPPVQPQKTNIFWLCRYRLHYQSTDTAEIRILDCLQTSCSELMTLAFSGENRSRMA